MLSELLRHPGALALSIVFHLLVIAAIFFNLHLSDKTVLVKQAELAKTVKAEIVDQQQLEAQKNSKKEEREAKRKRELEKQKREKDAERLEQEKKRKQEDEKKRKLEAEKKKKEEAKRVADAKKRAAKKRKEAEQLKKQQIAEKQQKLAEEKRKKEGQLAREAEQKRLEEKARKQEAEKRRLAEEDLKRRQQELKAKLESEESQRRLNSLREAYRLAIKQKIERNWRQPQERVKMPDCEVRVMQGPGGIILDVTFGACQGGTPTYRASIENAVYKAEPLPKPGDASLFERELIILFNPG